MYMFIQLESIPPSPLELYKSFTYVLVLCFVALAGVGVN